MPACLDIRYCRANGVLISDPVPPKFGAPSFWGGGAHVTASAEGAANPSYATDSSVRLQARH